MFSCKQTGYRLCFLNVLSRTRRVQPHEQMEKGGPRTQKRLFTILCRKFLSTAWEKICKLFQSENLSRAFWTADSSHLHVVAIIQTTSFNCIRVPTFLLMGGNTNRWVDITLKKTLYTLDVWLQGVLDNQSSRESKRKDLPETNQPDGEEIK